mgnify:CR=1 FL=1
MRVSFSMDGRLYNPSQVSSLQTLVLIYQPRKDGKLCRLGGNRKRHTKNVQISAEPGIDSVTSFVLEKQRSFHLSQPGSPYSTVRLASTSIMFIFTMNCTNEFLSDLFLSFSAKNWKNWKYWSQPYLLFEFVGNFIMT